MTENQIQFVTQDVVKELLATQERVFHSSLQLFVTDIRYEVRSVRKDFDELRRSLEFSQSQLKDTQDKVMNLDYKVESAKLSVKEHRKWLDYVDDQVEYIENQSRRNNIKIMRIEEDKKMEKSWDDMEKIVFDVICKKLRIQENLHIEHTIWESKCLTIMMG